MKPTAYHPGQSTAEPLPSIYAAVVATLFTAAIVLPQILSAASARPAAPVRQGVSVPPLPLLEIADLFPDEKSSAVQEELPAQF